MSEQDASGPGRSGPLRWGVVMVSLEPVEGHEQAGTRPVVVVSYEPFHRSGLMTVCPLTSSRYEARYPGEVPIGAGEGGLARSGVVLCAQVRTISIRRIADAPIGYVTSPETRLAIRRALVHHLGLDVPPAADAAGAP